MPRKYFLLIGMLAGAGVLTAATSESAAPDQIRKAATKAIGILQRSSQTFSKTQGCFSCHHAGLPMIALRAAREHGLPVDEAAAREVASKALWSILDRQSVDNAIQATYLIDPALSEGNELVAAQDAGVAPNLATSIYAWRLVNWQRPDGHWNTFDARPPQSHSRFTATAVALRAVQLYMPPRRKANADAAVTRARRWLLANEPQTTEDHTFRLLGLSWAAAPATDLHQAAAALLALQRPDGGWAQLPSRASDAYATGEVLVALQRAGGIAVSHPAWQRGLSYLLSTQKEEGIWRVATRQVSPAHVSPPYFETGIPYGHDQFLSAAATSWAVTALALALPQAPEGGRKPATVGTFAGATEPWMETALFGSAAELKVLLDKGLDPNSKTAAGSTLLMMAAADPEKVRLLLEVGADARAKAKSGFTALMAASLFQGSAASARQLLGKGAEINPGRDVVFDASPLFLATFAGERETVALLRTRGADIQRRMNLLGQFPASPLFAAAGLGDAEMVEDLLRYGAKVTEQDEFNLTALGYAALGNHVAVAKVLLEGGAEVDHVDQFGYTPLLYAATIDFGDTAMVRTLLEARADPKVRSKDGHTALAQAKRYGFAAIRQSLEAAGAKE
jgi:ankyrin repeat protein